MKVVVCPGCGARLKIVDDTIDRFACPKCKKEMRLAAKTASPNQPATSNSPTATPKPSPTPVGRASPAAPSPNPKLQRSQASQSAPPVEQSDPFAQQDIFGAVPPLDPFATSGKYSAPKSRKAATRNSQLGVFLKWLAIGVGAICLLIALTLPLTYVGGSALALVPIVIAFLATLGLATWAGIWFVVEGFKQSTLQGFLVLLVPYYWLYFLVTNKDRCVRPLAVMGASLVPAIMAFVIANFFKPDFAGGTQQSSSIAMDRSRAFQIPSQTAPIPSGMNVPNSQTNASPTDSNAVLASLKFSSEQRKVIQQKLEKQLASGATEVVQTRIGVSDIMRSDATLAAEQCLAKLPGYIAGSFRLSPDQKSLTFQYRGSPEHALTYAALLPGDAGVIIIPSATFE